MFVFRFAPSRVILPSHATRDQILFEQQKAHDAIPGEIKKRTTAR